VTFAEFQARSRFDQAELLAFARGTLVSDAPAGFAAVDGRLFRPE